MYPPDAGGGGRLRLNLRILMKNEFLDSVRNRWIVAVVAVSVISATSAIFVITTLPGFDVETVQISFSDQTEAAGLVFRPLPDNTMMGMGPGGTVGDFNDDGYPDIFLLGGGGVPDALYMNNGDGTFTDEAAAWGVDLAHRGHAATVGDYDSDGDLDFFITSSGDLTSRPRAGQHLLYQNNGDRTFTEVAGNAGVDTLSARALMATGATFGDYDLDGDLDLFASTWHSLGGTSDGNRLFENNGDGTFTDVTVAAGVFDIRIAGFSPRFVDMNGDRYPELIVAADWSSSRYFINNGNGTFTDGTRSAGTGLETNGMGSTVADFNGDGLFDWFVTSIFRDERPRNNGNFLYINNGNHTFTPLADAHGTNNGGWGWGADARDFDHDEDFDIVETNGWRDPEWTGENAYLFRNKGDGTFIDVAAPAGFVHTFEGRSLMTLDYDLDGDMDVVITAYNDPVKLLRNDISGAGTNWLKLYLDTSGDPTLAPGGFGTKVTITAAGRSQHYYLGGGATYLGQSELVAHFGLGSMTTVDRLIIEWANGGTTVLNDVAANKALTVSALA